MRPFVWVLLLAATSSACSAANNLVGSVTDDEHDGMPVSFTSMATWSGQPIEIDNTTYNGDVTVTGVDGLTNVQVTVTPVAFTKQGDATAAADATATLADVTASLKLDESGGRFTLRCAAPTTPHGNADLGVSGCKTIDVKVPTGTAAQGVVLQVKASRSLTATHLVFGNASTLTFNVGDATLSDVTGSVQGQMEV